MKNKRRIRIFSRRVLIKLISVIVLVSMLLDFSAILGSADSYYTLRINYVFSDGSPAHDPYIATFSVGTEVNLEVTNPNIDGYVPMSVDDGYTPQDLPEHGTEEKKTSFNIAMLDGNVTTTVYYIAGLTHYAARYYKQNIYDDLYTLDSALTEANKNLYGYTGSSPTSLEQVEIEGFTNLFHEPDAIAADGSTVFRVYYDRNYYSINFDLGSGGYGVEPVYAKYQTVYRIEQPKRMGYSFLGWARTDADSTKGVYGTDWNYIDENGNIITEAQATAVGNLVQLNGNQTVPSKNTYYKAVWTAGTSSFSVVYWLEKDDSVLDEHSFDNIGSMSDEQIKNMITENYNVLVAHDVTGITSGTSVDINTEITNAEGESFPLSNLFGFNLNEKSDEIDGSPVDSDGKKIDFLAMSEAQREELAPELQRYYELNSTLSGLQFSQGDIEIAGDGTTRINIYYSRKTFTLQFFYAKTSGGTVTYDENNVPHWDKGTNGVVYLTNGTKSFSNATETTASLYSRLNNNNLFTVGNVLDSLPEIVNHTDLISANFLDNGNNSNKIWYYEVQAKFGSSLIGKWFNDAFDMPLRIDANGDTSQKVYFGSWAVEIGSDYYDFESDNMVGRGNYTIKGMFERLYNEILLKDSFIESSNRGANFDYTELHFAASWDNTGKIGGKNWNDGADKVFNFTYKNCVELLPFEDYIAGTPNGYDILINGGTYPAGDHEELDENGNTVTVHYNERTIEGRYTDIIEMVVNGKTVRYGLTALNTIETYDAGSVYINSTTGELVSANTMCTRIRDNQTAVTLTGFKPYANNSSAIKNTFTVKSFADGELVTQTINTSYGNNTYSNGNAQAIFYAANGFNEKHHADVYFFYERNSYLLKYRNSNQLESDSHLAYYNAPLFLEKFSYTPEYYITELRDNYTFEGWFYDPFYLEPVDLANDTMPADDVTLYAKWAPKTIDVIFYNNYNDYYEDENRIVLGKDEDDNDITDWTVDYGTYTPLLRIPVNNDDEANIRPVLTPIAEDASFAGWYYIRNRVPVRFEPENVPVTALNEESVGENAKLRLFAEWVTKDVAKFKINYVEKEHPEKEVAASTTGRAFVYKTKTFNAKSGNELNDGYKWTAEGESAGTNWWPTTNSHSINIKANTQGDEYEPNTYTFEYIQKSSVHYKVQYLDAATRNPINPGGEDIIKDSTHASVKEDALVIPGYVAREASQTMVLTASTAETSEAQESEELAVNVITFLYDKNDTVYLYEAEYYIQDISGDSYSLYYNETLTAEIADEGDTTVRVAALYDRPIPTVLTENGYERKLNSTTYTVTDSTGTTEPESVADDGSVTLAPTDKRTIRIYFDRKTYSYSYQYIDHTQEKLYHNTPAEEREGMWDGVIATYQNAGTARVEAEVTLNPDEFASHTDAQTDETTDYVRIGGSEVSLTIQPDEDNPDVNLVKIYYRKDTERQLEYKMVCVNNNADTDYDSVTGDPLFGRLTFNMQTVQEYDGIQNVQFFNNNDEKVDDGSGHTSYMHLHKYKFLGWYTTPEYDPEHPEANRLTTNEILTKENLGTNGELPVRDAKYYALVEQVMVTMDVMFYYVDDYTVNTLRAEDTGTLKNRLQTAWENGEVTGTGERVGEKVVFTNPNTYQNHTQIPWHRNDGYSLHMDPIDHRVYKYEFAEWWERDEDNNYDFIRKENWNNSGEWSASSLSNQLSRNKNQCLIAVYARREVESIPYTINYNFVSRLGDTKTFVSTGTLTRDQLKENAATVKINSSGCYELTDEFIIANSPYESNYGQTLSWSDQKIEKTSYKGDENEETVDRIVTNVTAVQNAKTVFANYRTTPNGEFTTIRTTYGANYKLDEQMLAIEAPESYNGYEFSYWAVRKTNSDSSPIVAKSYETLFDLCMMDNYYITPVYEGAAASGPGTKTVVLEPADGIAQGNEDWLAWTWNDGEEGTWVRADSSLTFKGLNDKVKFVRVQSGTDISDDVWDETMDPYVWNYTDDLTVWDKGTYSISSYDNQIMLGKWIPPTDGLGTNSAILNTSNIDSLDDSIWIAWTQNYIDDGTWVRPDSNMTFRGLKDEVVFFEMDPNVVLSPDSWDGTDDYIRHMTGYLNVQNGKTFTLSGELDSVSGYMLGSWGTTTDVTPTENPTEEPPAPSEPEVVLTHLDYTRNRWTDENGNISSTGETDLLFTDFEIAFEDNGKQIYGNGSGYQAGVVFELCGSLSATATFNPDRNYGFYSDPDALKTAITEGYKSYTTQNKEGSPATKTRSIQCSEINTANMTNRNRIEFSQYYKNAYKTVENGDGTTTTKYTNSNYLMKATAYLIKDDTVTLSNSIYICLKSEAAKDLAIGDNYIWETTPTTP